MNKKLILSSLTVLGLVSPALAAQYASFPSDKLMKEDMVYTNAATKTNMGVYEGTVTAEAIYDVNKYLLKPGFYLPGTLEALESCPADSYCPGGYDVEYSEQDQGIESCPGDYPFADVGSSSAIQCYKPCDDSLFQNAKELVSGGRDYYSSGEDTCQIASCENGYYVSKGSSFNIYGLISKVSDRSGTINNDENGWTVDYDGTGIVLSGQAKLSSQTGIITEAFDYIAEDSGSNCFCNITEYKEYGYKPSRIMASKWVYLMDGFSSDKACGEACAEAMGSGDGGSAREFRSTLLGNITYVSDACMPNTIIINWEGAAEEDVLSSEAGSVEYGGDIKTPLKAKPVPGKTFVGWKFQENVSQ